jgi:RNA polymerase sigma-70 factor (ECF subfamily)
MSSVNDWDLVARAQQGDMNAFAELVQRYQTPVVQFCYRMVGSALDAEDIAQECFVRVYRHLGRLRPQAKFSTLLFGIARNLTLNFLRDAKRRGHGRDQPLETLSAVRDDTQRPDGMARLREIEELVARGMELLSSDHREILVLREVNGLDYEAIAQVVRCRKGTVKSRLARAREQLRAQVVRLAGEVI